MSEQHAGGRHVLIDLYGAINLGDENYIRKACEDAAKATGATILGSNFHHFGSGYGVSGVVLLAESHLSTHTWPEKNFAAFDVFVCGDCDPLLAIPILQERFDPAEMVIQKYNRGEFNGKG